MDQATHDMRVISPLLKDDTEFYKQKRPPRRFAKNEWAGGRPFRDFPNHRQKIRGGRCESSPMGKNP